MAAGWAVGGFLPPDGGWMDYRWLACRWAKSKAVLFASTIKYFYMFILSYYSVCGILLPRKSRLARIDGIKNGGDSHGLGRRRNEPRLILDEARKEMGSADQYGGMLGRVGALPRFLRRFAGTPAKEFLPCPTQKEKEVPSCYTMLPENGKLRRSASCC